ncbi:unnamed protein product [Lathyrus oleraceus]
MESPRMVDRFNAKHYKCPKEVELVHVVKEWLGVSTNKHLLLKTKNVNNYAACKELYLGRKCEVLDTPRP